MSKEYNTISKEYKNTSEKFLTKDDSEGNKRQRTRQGTTKQPKGTKVGRGVTKEYYSTE